MIALLVVCLIAGALLASLEEALGALGIAKLKALRDAGGRVAPTAERLLREQGAVRGRLLTLRTLSLAIVIAMVLLLTARGGWPMATLWTAAAAMLFAALVELATALMKRLGDRAVLVGVRWLHPVELLAAPLAWPLTALRRALAYAFPRRAPLGDVEVAELEVEHMIGEGEASGAIARDHAELLRSVFEFKDTVAKEIMVPRSRIEAIDIESSLEQAVAVAVSKGHSRYPVYRNTLDQIEGVLYAKDLFRAVAQSVASETTLESLMRKPVSMTSENKKIGILLREMQARRVHLTLVVDEFGSTRGLVTLEDILEEIVGEIHDEHDRENAPIRHLGYQHLLVVGSTDLGEVESYLGQSLLDDVKVSASGDFSSLAGFVVAKLGRVPQSGERIELPRFALTVREADEKHIALVEIAPIAVVSS